MTRQQLGRVRWGFVTAVPGIGLLTMLGIGVLLTTALSPWLPVVVGAALTAWVVGNFARQVGYGSVASVACGLAAAVPALTWLVYVALLLSARERMRSLPPEATTAG